MEQEPMQEPGAIKPWLLITLGVVILAAIVYFSWYYISQKKAQTVANIANNPSETNQVANNTVTPPTSVSTSASVTTSPATPTESVVTPVTIITPTPTQAIAISTFNGNIDGRTNTMTSGSNISVEFQYPSTFKVESDRDDLIYLQDNDRTKSFIINYTAGTNIVSNSSTYNYTSYTIPNNAVNEFISDITNAFNFQSSQMMAKTVPTEPNVQTINGNEVISWKVLAIDGSRPDNVPANTPWSYEFYPSYYVFIINPKNGDTIQFQDWMSNDIPNNGTATGLDDSTPINLSNTETQAFNTIINTFKFN